MDRRGHLCGDMWLDMGLLLSGAELVLMVLESCSGAGMGVSGVGLDVSGVGLGVSGVGLGVSGVRFVVGDNCQYLIALRPRRPVPLRRMERC